MPCNIHIPRSSTLKFIPSERSALKLSFSYFPRTGDIVVRPTWGKDQPNNYNGEQNCVVLDGGRNWLWNDVGCNLDYLHFICQHQPLSCGSPDVLYNTTIVGKNFSVGAIVEYKCPKEHSLVGNSTRECQSNGFWSDVAPTCKCK
jgi:hypothetical protein